MEAGPIKRPAYLVYHWFWQSLDWIYPPACGGCGLKGERWCQSCNQQAEVIGSRVCTRCGEPLPAVAVCPACQKRTSPFQSVRSWAAFSGPVRAALHRLKYRRDLGLGEALSHPLKGFFLSLNWQVDLIVPVPLSRARLKERGYNQVSLLARPMALATGLRYQPQALERVRDTPSQVGLSSRQRRENVSGAFRGDSSLAKGRRILVIDDVMTTGATLEACAQALVEAGASAVMGLTLARAVQNAA
jgi:ComF family protein